MLEAQAFWQDLEVFSGQHLKHVGQWQEATSTTSEVGAEPGKKGTLKGDEGLVLTCRLYSGKLLKVVLSIEICVHTQRV